MLNYFLYIVKFISSGTDYSTVLVHNKLITLTPVSYTHLDVYKRQLLKHMKSKLSEMAYNANKIYFVTEYNQICN